VNGDYPVHPWIECIDAYKIPEDIEDWLDCRYCGLKPRVWLFDNGRSTACGCFKDQYDHFSIHAESIMSTVTQAGGKSQSFDRDDLRKNWNHWCKTGEVLFEHAGRRVDGKW